MTGRRIRAFPADASSIQTTTLNGVQYQFRLTWRWRLSSWWLDVLDADGVEIEVGRRLSADRVTIRDLSTVGVAGDILFSDGLDGYERADLGDGLILFHFTAAELVTVQAELGTATATPAIDLLP